MRFSCKASDVKCAAPAIQEQLRLLSDATIDVTIEKHSNRKSNRQNRYFRGVVVPIIANYAGYTDDEAIGVIKARWFTDTLDDGEAVVRSTRNTDWTTASWEAKMEQIRRDVMIMWDVYIPEPNEDF